MSWEREILDTTVEDLVSRNSHMLLASQLRSTCQRVLDMYASHNEEVERMKAQLTEAERIGIRVQHLNLTGRKTVRISEFMGEVNA